MRSATLGLGVLQMMAKLPDPAGSPGPLNSSALGAPPQLPWPLLAQFDFISTVGGGGFIGGFLCSLFVRGRLSGRSHETPFETTAQAYRVLQEDPPGAPHRYTSFDPKYPGSAALAWLRGNSRFVVANRSGSRIRDVGETILNWAAMQIVMATLILLVLASVQAARWTLAYCWSSYADLEADLLSHATRDAYGIWWSSLWILSAGIVWLTFLPLGMAHWLCRPVLLSPHLEATKWPSTTLPRYVNAPVGISLLLGLLMIALSLLFTYQRNRYYLGTFMGAIGIVILLAACWHTLSAWQTQRSINCSIARQRHQLSSWLSNTVWILLLTLGLGLIDTLGQTAWLWLSMWKLLALWGGIVAAVLLLNRGRTWQDEGSDNGLLKTAVIWLSDRFGKLPLNWLSLLLGCGLWMSLAVSLDLILLSFVWPSGWADPLVLANVERTLQAEHFALMALAGSMLLALLVARYPSFLNLSGSLSAYTERITRTYLGASNHTRFEPSASTDASEASEPIQGDHLSLEDIYRNHLAPIHLIHVCANQTVSLGEQQAQSNRKGKPLAVAPGGIYAYGKSICWPHEATSEVSRPLTYGDWLGISASDTATDQRMTRDLGMRLSLGFANVRSGHWWQGPLKTPWMRNDMLRRALPTQLYLLDKLKGCFFGEQRPYQYLTGGGDFDELGLYELLRPEAQKQRQIRLILSCDFTCDPDYRFDALANLTRMVRIDHGLELKVHPHAHNEALLNQVFCRPEDFKANAAEATGRCAVMLDVLGTERSVGSGVASHELIARIILIKPVQLPNMSVDVTQHYRRQPHFPQEAELNQSEDEAQWESYRQLGMHLAGRVFSNDGMPGYSHKFWQVLLSGLKS